MKKRFVPLDTTPLVSRPLEGGDPVVLPSGKRAIVLKRVDSGKVECRYMGGGAHDTVIVGEDLVRLIRPGVMPPPVRVRRVS